MSRLFKSVFCLLSLVLLSIIFYKPIQASASVNACQCTDFVYLHRPDIPHLMGHAKDWLSSARSQRFPYDQVPQVGDVAVILHGEYGFSAEYGHVAIVIQVNEARDRFGFAGWDGLKADCQVEVYLDLPVSDNTFFIHRKEISQEPVIVMSKWLLPIAGSIQGWRETLQSCLDQENGDIIKPSNCIHSENCCVIPSWHDEIGLP
jgi:hypothetical protein